MRPHDEPAAAGGAPWAIPIREASPDIPQRYATWVDRVPVVPAVAAVVVLFVVVVAAVVLMGDGAEPAGPEVAGSQITRDADTSSTTAPTTSSTTTTFTTASSTTVTSTPTSTPPTMAADTAGGTSDESSASGSGTSRPADTVTPEPTDLPILDPAVLPAGWVAQISSVPSADGGNALTTAYETVTQTMPDVVILRGSDWPSLRDGFWVIVEPGFESGSEAVAACVDAGRPDRDDCFGRYLDPSDSSDSGERICAREPDGTVTGDC
ncbi:MAG: hypothetical protein U5K30_04530 [Acidimicrobiales bacterium]|nr:hypothetical protein [Acidimicrobiales bacterium]